MQAAVENAVKESLKMPVKMIPEINESNVRVLVERVNARGGGALQLHLYGGVWPQDWKIDPSAD